MQINLRRLRRGEWVAGASAALLLVCLLVLKWYRYRGGVSLNGWHALSHLRWFALVVIAAALLLIWVQASRRSPALPATISMIVTTLAGLLVLALVYRVLLNAPATQKAGAFVGLAAAAGILVGGYSSMRSEGIRPEDAPREIETVRLSDSGG
jgi:hypothetical protein